MTHFKFRSVINYFKDIDYGLLIVLAYAKTIHIWSYFNPNISDVVRIGFCLIILLSIPFFKLSKTIFYILIFDAIWIATFFLVGSSIAEKSRGFSQLFELVFWTCIALVFDNYLKSGKFYIFAKTYVLAGIIIFTINCFIGPLLLDDNSIILLSTTSKTFAYGYTGYNLQYWIIGDRNYISLFLLEWIMVAALLSLRLKKRITTSVWIIIATCMVFAILIWSATTITIMALLIAFMLFGNVVKRINLYHYFFISIVMEILILFFNAQSSFARFIENVLHRNITFTGRVYIWDQYLSVIREHLIIGFNNGRQYVHGGFINDYVSTHNFWLDVLYHTGVIGTAIYFALILRICYILSTYNNTPEARITSFIVFLFLVNGIFVFSAPNMFTFLIIAVNIPKILLCNDKEVLTPNGKSALRL